MAISLRNLSLLFLVFSGSISANASDSLILQMSVDEETVSVVLVNETSRQMSASENYALSGFGGGNVIPLVVTGIGQMIPPCNYMDTFVDIRKPSQIEPGQRITIWKGTAEILANLHCLKAGSYTLAFAYSGPDGNLVFTAGGIALVVGEKTRAKVEERSSVDSR